MILSFRHLTDDHFWFSLFHEAGHLILHEDDGLFLELKNSADKDKEEEANLFAQNILIPETERDEFLSLNEKSWKKIVRFSKKIGVSTGIVVGQLQHAKRVDHGKLEKLKTRYKWN